jgi:tetratricopeptide (TPR) repeat protein
LEIIPLSLKKAEMMSERENYELIEKYLAQELTETEARAFEKRALEDPEFAEEVVLHTLARQEMEAAASVELKERLQANFGKAHEASVISMQRTRRQWLSIAAVILVLVVCLPFLKNIFAPNYITSEEIYAQHFQSPDLRTLDTTRGEGEEKRDSVQQTWSRALMSISENQPAVAIKQFDTLMQDTLFMRRFNNTIIYQVGVAWLLNGDPEKAISYFDQVDPESTFGANASWYKGMAYLKMDDRAQALVVFNEAIDDPRQNSVRKEEARKIVEKLKSDNP